MRYYFGLFRIYVLFNWTAFKKAFKGYFNFWTLLLFGFVCAVIGSEVWIPLVLGWVFNNKWLLGVAATCEAFWLAPFTPFIPLCIIITLAIRKWQISRKEHFKYK